MNGRHGQPLQGLCWENECRTPLSGSFWHQDTQDIRRTRSMVSEAHRDHSLFASLPKSSLHLMWTARGSFTLGVTNSTGRVTPSYWSHQHPSRSWSLLTAHLPRSLSHLPYFLHLEREKTQISECVPNMKPTTDRGCTFHPLGEHRACSCLSSLDNSIFPCSQHVSLDNALPLLSQKAWDENLLVSLWPSVSVQSQDSWSARDLRSAKKAVDMFQLLLCSWSKTG